jgi:Kef-type K+ transport system membrane component KefB
VPDVEHWLFGPQALPSLQALSNLGLALFMFLIGLEFHLPDTRGRGGTAVVVGLASIAVPLLSGILVSPLLARSFGLAGANRLHLALFVGVAMSVTAFPVLARILIERGVLHSPLGSFAVACAAVADIVAWVLLVGVVAVSHGGSPVVAARTAALSVVFLLGIWFVVRPLLASLFRDGRGLPDGGELAVVAAGILFCAAATDAIGIHLIFGAFLFGAAFPRGSARLGLVADRIEPLTSALLLPLFFALVGLQTDFTAIGDATLLLWALPALLGIALVGKWAATAGAGRLLGLDAGTSHRLGALMACKGLTELVVLSVGRDLGLLSPRLFSLLVLVALAATAATAPSLDLLDRISRRRTGAPAAWTIGFADSVEPEPERRLEPELTPSAVPAAASANPE